MKTSFMTFVCPDWTIEQVVDFAKKAGYDGVEIRVDAGHKHDVSSQSSADRRKYVRKLFADAGVAVSCIATSVTLSSPDAANRQQNIDSAKANMALASDLGAGVIRTFAGGHVPAVDEAAAVRLASAYDELGEYGQPLGVCPMLETGHDIMKGAAEIAMVLPKVKTANFGALWNFSEMDDETLAAIRSRLRHFHVHDEVLEPGNANILKLAKQVKPVGFHGYVSIEVIKGHNLPEDQLTETAQRLKTQMQQVYGR